MKIKVCGITSQENLESLLQLSPDFTGFIFYSASKRCVKANEPFRRFVRRIVSTQKVGVFVNASPTEIAQRVGEYRLDLIQLHGSESPEMCAKISSIAPVIKAFGIRRGFDFSALEKYEHTRRCFLLDNSSAGHGGSGKTFDWRILDQYRSDVPFILSGGIGPEHFPKIKSLKQSALVGIDLNSRFETSVGVKNISQLRNFFYEIRS